MKYRDLDVSFETKLVRGDQGWDPHTGAVSFPVYLSSTFRHPSLGETTGWDYSRQSNPTRAELEKAFAPLEGAHQAFAFSTGMAAFSALMELFQAGDHLIICEDLYGGTYRYCQELGLRHGLDFTYVDTQDPRAVEAQIRPQTKALVVETPSNPTMRISDLKTLGTLCKTQGLFFIVDNTFLTPYFQRPLEWGADAVFHSATKFLGGHNDLLAGLVAVKDPEVADRMVLIQKTLGNVLGPFESWLLLRGMKTLAVRMDRQAATAQKIAQFLTTHPEVTQVYFPGLPSHPGQGIQTQQASGPGAMVSFRVKSKKMVEQVLARVQLIIFAESLGGTETLITFPLVQTHGAIPEDIRRRSGVDDTLLRLSVGLESPEDLIQDLTQALKP